ncbi:MAG TPA: PspC domain-containing protein [Verrucomicrobiae bacterium]|nr:PspC domain-containing protein [Verrucomicrobiae bacterium]
MKLHRSQNSRMIAGVCGGLAEYLGWSPARTRIVWVLATVFTAFAGVIVYIALWFLMPKVPPVQPTFETPPLQPWKKSTTINQTIL